MCSLRRKGRYVALLLCSIKNGTEIHQEMGYVKPPKPSIEIITPPKIPLKPLNSRLGVSTQANRRLEVKLEMTYWSFRSKARPIFGASRYSSVRIQLLSIRGDLASRSESSTFSRASSSPPNGILRAPGPPRSSHEQRGLADAPIAWDSNFRSFTSPASLRCGWSDVPRQPSVSMTTAAACRVCKPSGVIGLPLINCRFFGRSRAVDTQRYVCMRPSILTSFTHREDYNSVMFLEQRLHPLIPLPLLIAYAEYDSAVKTDARFRDRYRTKGNESNTLGRNHRTRARRPKCPMESTNSL